MSENTSDTSPVESTSPKEVKVTDKNSPFFDKVFTVLEETEEYVVGLIKFGEREVTHLFTKGQTTPKENTPIVTTIAGEPAKQ